MTCGYDKCEAGVARGDDLFCAEHWKQLPRWARVELVRLRNEAARGNRQATLAYLKAGSVARHMLSEAAKMAAAPT